MRSFHAAAFLVAGSFHFARARWVSDERVTSHTVTPVLGRGFSTASGHFFSTCLLVDGAQDPSTDYEYFYTEIRSEANIFDDLSGKLANSIAGRHLESSFMADQANSADEGMKAHHIVATMLGEHYYDFLDETGMELDEVAEENLGTGNVILFYQTCGPNFVRSLRRTTEITALFSYFSASTYADTAFADSLTHQTQFKGEGMEDSFVGNSAAESLIIRIFAFGMSMGAADDDEDGEFTLHASDMEGYADVMDTAFASMQDPNAGAVRAMEIVPWTSLPNFYNNLQIDVTPGQVAYGCIFNDADATVNVHGVEATCVQGVHCGYNVTGEELFDENLCQVLGAEDVVQKDMRRYYLTDNAELVVQLDHLVRTEMMKTQKIIQCRQELEFFPSPEYDRKELFNRAMSFYRNSVNVPMNIQTLRFRLMYGDTIAAPIGNPGDDPLAIIGDDAGNYIFQRRMTHVRNFMSYVFEPCLLELGDESYGIMFAGMHIRHWTAIPECAKMKCLLPGYRWNSTDPATPEIGDCIPWEEEFVGIDLRVDEYCPPELQDWVIGDAYEELT